MCGLNVRRDAGISTAPSAPEAPGRRLRVLFIAEAVSLAHVARPFFLAQSLDPSRYEVHFACDPRYNKLLGPIPFPHHPISTIPSDELDAKLAQGRPFYNTKTLQEYVEDDLKVLEEITPDLVVGDDRWPLSVSARHPQHRHRQRLLEPLRPPPISGAGCAADALSGHAAGQRRVPAVLPADLRLVLPAAQPGPPQVRITELGFQSLPHVHRWGLHTVCRCAGAGADVRPAGQPSVFGPGPVAAAVELPEWWDSLPTDRPIVYATLGTSGGRSLLQVVLDALADQPVTVIAATADRSDLTNVPANAFVADYLPGEAAAARSAVVICNGGSMTTQQALVAGVPVVGLATNMDQHMNMEAIERAGAGVLLRTERLTPARVANAVQQALGRPYYRQAARRLAEALSRNFAGFPHHVKTALHLLSDGRIDSSASRAG